MAITKNNRIINPQINFNPPLQNEMKHFIACIQTGRTPLTNIDFGCRITEWLEKITSHLTNKQKGIQ